MNTLLPRTKADYVGITGSVLCIIHCVATPFLLLTASWLRHDLMRTGFLSLDYVFIGINMVAVYSATRHTSTPLLKAVLRGSLALFIVCLMLEEQHTFFAYGAYLASAGLITGHIMNIRYCRRHDH